MMPLGDGRVRTVPWSLVFSPRRNGCVIDCSATTEVILVFTEEINGWTCAKTVTTGTGKVERRGPIKTGKEV